MRVTLGPVMSRVETDTPGELMEARRAVTVYVPGFQFSFAFRAKRWNGKRCFLHLRGKDRTAGEILTGLVPFVAHTAKRVEYLEGEGNGGSLPPLQLPEKLPELRDYQVNAVEEMRRKRRGIIELAAGAGKTEIAIAFTSDFLARAPGPVLYLCYGVSLVKQCYARFSRSMPDVGIVLRDRLELTDGVVIASVTTLYKHRRKFLPFLEGVQALILDECQLSTSDTWHLLGLLCTAAENRFGLSATPFTGDPVRDLLLIGQTSQPIAQISAARLVEMGYTARPDVRMVRAGHRSYGEYEDAVRGGIVENSWRNGAIASLAARHPEARILILVARTAHGETLQELVPGSVFVHGGVAVKKRDEAFASRVAIATSVADFGLDLDVDVLILAGGGRGKGSDHEPVRLVQRLGRGQRRHRGKAEVIVYDFFDAGDRHLEKHSRERRKAWESEGFPPKMEVI